MQPLRASLLWASQNRRIESIVRASSAMRPLVSRFMPGETIDDVLPAVQALRAEQTPSIITYLGENVSSDAAADQTVAEYERLLAALTAASADAHVSIKLTQFGWDLDRARALDRVRAVAKMAAAAGTILAIDMESSLYVESTVDAYESLSREFSETTLCLQAYLHRTPGDVQRLLATSPYIRLVKGAYREPADRALQNRHEVTARYRALARELLAHVNSGARVAFGTHDLDLLRQIRADARELGVPSNAYEIQMLYGIQNEARRALAAEGEHVRVLISYGKAWYAWFMRRLAEKPSNLMLIARK
ncbi:MAG TPA: proline dehydrogenase family protein [Gemmatimonadaceae bacterium]|nr:proline dehydrogenase family protein [Gemmatimonadaceae bacterium]